MGLYSNYPTFTYVGANGISVSYNGDIYTVEDFHTNKRYIYWSAINPSKLNASNIMPDKNAGQILVIINDNGIAVEVPNDLSDFDISYDGNSLKSTEGMMQGLYDRSDDLDERFSTFEQDYDGINATVGKVDYNYKKGSLGDQFSQSSIKQTSNLNVFKDNINQCAKDSALDPTEIALINSQKNIIVNGYNDLVLKIDDVIAFGLEHDLTDEVNVVKTSKTNLTTTHNNLLNTISTAISDNILSPSDITNITNSFAQYHLKMTDIKNSCNDVVSIGSGGSIMEEFARLGIKSNEINLAVSSKVGGNEVINSINVSTEGVKIDARKLDVKGKFSVLDTNNNKTFEIDSNGDVTINAKNFTLQSKELVDEDAIAKLANSLDVYYYLSTSNTVLSGGSWSTLAPTWVNGKYMWSKTITTFKDGTTKESTPVCIAGAKGDAGAPGLQGIQGEKGDQGVPGANGTNGQTSYFHIKYSPVQNPTSGQMTETPNTFIGTYVDFVAADSTDPTKYTWSRFEGIQGSQGNQGIPGVNGSNGQTSYLHIKYSNVPNPTSSSQINDIGGDYIGQYTDFVLEDSTDPTKYTWSKIKGEPGVNAITPNLTNDSHIVPTDENGNNGNFTGCNSTIELYDGGTKITSGVTYSQVVSSGVTGSLSGATYTVTALSVDSGYVDLTATYNSKAYTQRFTITKAKKGTTGTNGSNGTNGTNGNDAYTINMSNDTHAFSTDSTGNIASAITTSTTITAFKGTASITPTIGTLPTVTGLTLSKSGTTITIVGNIGTSLADNGTFDIPITVDGKSFTKTFSWAKAKQGTQGVPGIQGVPGANGQPTYTWVKYADSSTGSGMSDLPDNKTYIGFAYNKTTATESTNASDYTWSLIQGPQGTTGANGITYYTWLKYADTPTTGMSDSPTGKLYMGIAYNKTTATESTNYADYSWSLIKGDKGDIGNTGNGVSSITEEYYLSTSKTTQSGGSWVTTPPTWSTGMYMWTRSKIMYTDSATPVYTTPICDSSWEAVNDVEIGGRNYATRALISTTKLIGTGGTLNVNHAECSNGFYLVNNSTKSDTARMSNVITENGIWTISFDIKGSQGTSVGVLVDICDSTPTRLITNSTNTWRRVSLTANISNYSTTYNFIDFIPDWAYIFIKNIKVEKGNKATDWTPAPEDVDSAIGNKVDATQQAIFNTLTNNGVEQGIYLQNGKLYVNATYMKSGTIEGIRIISQSSGSKVIMENDRHDYYSSTLLAGSIGFDSTGSGSVSEATNRFWIKSLNNYALKVSSSGDISIDAGNGTKRVWIDGLDVNIDTNLNMLSYIAMNGNSISGASSVGTTELLTNKWYSTNGGKPIIAEYIGSELKLYPTTITGTMYPSYNNGLDLGTSTNRYRTIYSVNALNTSDKTYKENIEYVKDGDISLRTLSEDITLIDMRDFVRDVDVAKYNYIGQEHEEFGFIADEIASTKVGSKLVVGEEGNYAYSIGSYISVVMGALKEEINIRDTQIANLEERLARLESLLIE